MPAKKYHVFISYSSADRPWAQKLFNDLEQKGLTLFFDQPRLEAGAPWEPQLLSALQDSQHLVVLWSENARKSDWVRRELGHFDAIIHPPAAAQPQASGQQRLIFLLLEGENVAYSSYQQIADLKNANAYAQGLEQLNPNLWQQVVDKVYQAIQSDETALPIPLALLTMTRDQLEQLDSTRKPPFGESLDVVLDHAGLGTKDNTLQFYGPQRTDWQPFGSSKNIQTILSNLKDDLNQALGTPQIRWEPIGEAFWSADQDAAQREVDKLLASISVIVIDPLALYHDEVKARFDLLYKCFDNDKTVIMVLPPFAIPSPNLHFRALVKQMAKQVFDHVYPPVIDDYQHKAICSVNVGDELDIKQLLFTVVAAHLKIGHTQRASEFLRPPATIGGR